MGVPGVEKLLTTTKKMSSESVLIYSIALMINFSLFIKNIFTIFKDTDHKNMPMMS